MYRAISISAFAREIIIFRSHWADGLWSSTVRYEGTLSRRCSYYSGRRTDRGEHSTVNEIVFYILKLTKRSDSLQSDVFFENWPLSLNILMPHAWKWDHMPTESTKSNRSWYFMSRTSDKIQDMHDTTWIDFFKCRFYQS